MSSILNSMSSVAWSLIPIMLLFLIFGMILLLFVIRDKITLIVNYLRRITLALERMSGSNYNNSNTSDNNFYNNINGGS